jgi:hypothetical protein
MSSRYCRLSGGCITCSHWQEILGNFRTAIKNKMQNIEFDSLAPDTIEEVFNACRLLEIWTAEASLRKKGVSIEKKKESELMQIGKKLLAGSEKQAAKLKILGENMEKSDRPVVVLKVFKSYQAYKDMIHYYCVKNLMEYLKSNPKDDFNEMCNTLKNDRITKWINLGGQLVHENDLDRLRADIGTGILNSWNEIHARYNKLWEQYPLEKQKHAFASLCSLLETKSLSRKQWTAALDYSMKIQEFIRDQVFVSRKKDYDNTFRRNTYRNITEMNAAIGRVEDNNFIKLVRDETEVFRKCVNDFKKRI